MCFALTSGVRRRAALGLDSPCWVASAAREDPEHPGAADPVLVLDPQVVEDRLHPLSCAVLLQPELGMAVEIAADLDHPGQDLAGGGQDLCRLGHG